MAIKRVDKLFDNAVNSKLVLRELKLMKKLNHPNITKLIDILLPDDFEWFNEVYIVMDYCKSDL